MYSSVCTYHKIPDGSVKYCREETGRGRKEGRNRGEGGRRGRTGEIVEGGKHMAQKGGELEMKDWKMVVLRQSYAVLDNFF